MDKYYGFSSQQAILTEFFFAFFPGVHAGLVQANCIRIYFTTCRFLLLLSLDVFNFFLNEDICLRTHMAIFNSTIHLNNNLLLNSPLRTEHLVAPPF